MRLSRSAALVAGAAATAALLLASSGAHAQQAPSTPVDEAGWQGVLGVRAAVSTAQRYIVLLSPPSLAARVRAAGGEATEKEMTRVDVGRRRAAGAVPRAALGSRSARRAGVSLRAGRERVLRPPRPDIAGAARPRPRGDRDLSGSHRLSGAVEPGREACCPPLSQTWRSPGSTARESPSRSSTPASIRRIRTSGSASSRAST